VRQEPAFWDSSAIVPLCVRQQNTHQARLHARNHALHVWWATFVEIRSAVARLRLSGLLNEQGEHEALARHHALSLAWKEIRPDDSVRNLACQLLGQHRLRAADSLQLAAALVWCYERPKQRLFLSGDQRLSQAAESAGFSVIQL